MNLTEIIHKRYSTKAYNPSRRVSDDTVNELLTLLRYSPSSVNSQPWHFVVFRSEESKAQLAAALGEAYSFNQAKVRDSSFSILFCVKDELTDGHLRVVLEQEAADGRFATDEIKTTTDNVRKFFCDIHRKTLNDAGHWMEKQVYLSLGSALLAAGVLGLDATPIEGFDLPGVDAAFNLKEKGLKSVVLMTVGYRSEKDFNAALPKSRLPESDVITRL